MLFKIKVKRDKIEAKKMLAGQFGITVPGEELVFRTPHHIIFLKTGETVDNCNGDFPVNILPIDTEITITIDK